MMHGLGLREELNEDPTLLPWPLAFWEVESGAVRCRGVHRVKVPARPASETSPSYSPLQGVSPLCWVGLFSEAGLFVKAPPLLESLWPPQLPQCYTTIQKCYLPSGPPFPTTGPRQEAQVAEVGLTEWGWEKTNSEYT